MHLLIRLVQLTGLVALAATVACASAAEKPAGRICVDAPVVGEPTQFTLANQSIDGVDIGESTECENGHYIPLRGDGHRQLVLSRQLDDDLPQQCRRVPTDDDACPRIQVDDFYREVWEEFDQMGVSPDGVGSGPCATIGETYTDFEFSFVLSDWADVDAVIEVVARGMQRWQIESEVGVAVRPEHCAETKPYSLHPSPRQAGEPML